MPWLQAIHFHLLQDIYDWAGDLRTVGISKGNTRFANVSRIEPEADKLFSQLGREGNFTSLPPSWRITTANSMSFIHFVMEMDVHKG